MFENLKAKTTTAFDQLNGEISEVFDSVNAIPAQFNTKFGEDRSLVTQMPQLTNLALNGAAISWDPTLIAGINAGAVEGPAFSKPVAGAPSFGLGQAYPYYPGSNMAPFYSIYGMSGNAWYNSTTQTGSANGSISYVGPPMIGVTSEVLIATASYNTASGAQPQTYTMTGTYTKAFVNGDFDNWNANINMNGGATGGTLSIGSKRGPVSVHGAATLSNGQVVSRNVTVDVVLPNNELHMSYSQSLYGTTRNATYKNTVIGNVTLVAEYSFDDKVGTYIGAGTGWSSDPYNYISASVFSYQPLTGPASTAARITGVMQTSNPQWSLVTDVTLTNGNVSNDGSQLWNTYSTPPKTPNVFRASFLDSFYDFKGSWWAGLGFGWNY